MKFYVTRLILNQIYSSSSPFYNKYRKENKENIDAGEHMVDSQFDDSHSKIMFLIDTIAYQEDDNFIDETINGDILAYVNKNGLLTYWYEKLIFYRNTINLELTRITQIKVSYRSLEEGVWYTLTLVHYGYRTRLGRLKEKNTWSIRVTLAKQKQTKQKYTYYYARDYWLCCYYVGSHELY